MPRDALHRQHLSAWADWRLAGGRKRGLKLDCAGLTLAVYALAQTLAPRVPALAAIAMTVRRIPTASCACNATLHSPETV